MKNRLMFTVALVGGLLLMAGCGKEPIAADVPEGALVLETEGFGGKDGFHTPDPSQEGWKTSVNGQSVVWVDGDRVLLGGVEYAVTVAGGMAYVVDFQQPEGVFMGVYPAGIVASQTSVTVPSRYECYYEGGRQVLRLPLLAMANAGAEVIRFRHATAAVRVLLKNDLGVDVVLDRVVVSSSGQLCGTRGVTLGVGSLAVGAQSDPVAADYKQVEVVFADSPVIADGGQDVREVQVPVLPVADGDMTIAVYTHMAGLPKGACTFTFSHTERSGQLDRNVMMTARIDLRLANTVKSEQGKFSVGDGVQVFFAQGNLQYRATSGVFRFAEHQYDALGDLNQHIGSGYDGWIDLFGWGTSGYDDRSPYMSSEFDDNYYAGSIAGTQYDWGLHNAIAGAGPAGTWRTMTTAEWDYLLNQRSGDKHYAKVGLMDGSVLVENGLVLFPDGYNYDDGLDEDLVDDPEANYYPVQLDVWETMEARGAVFLPTGGYREGTNTYDSESIGYYWPSNWLQNGVRQFLFSNTVVDPNATGAYAHYGYAVRLVRTAE